MNETDEMLNQVVKTIGETMALVNEALAEMLEMHTEFFDRLLAMAEGSEDEEWEDE